MRILFRAALGLVVAGWAINATAQVAHFDFNGDVDDAIGGYHGSVAGTVTFPGGTHAEVSSTGVVALPVALTDQLLMQNFGFGFDFRLSTVEASTMLLSVSAVDPGRAIWETPGVMLLVQGGALIMSFNDGTDPENYEFIEVFSGMVADQWYDLDLVFDPDAAEWRLTLDGTIEQRTMQIDWTAASFRSGLAGVKVSIGGADGEKIGYPAAFDVDELSVYAPAQVSTTLVNQAYNELRLDLINVSPVTEQERIDYFNVIRDQLPFVPFAEVSAELFAYTSEYEAANPPLYDDGVLHLFDDLPVHARVLQYSQQYLLTRQFVAANVAAVEGVVFEHHEVIPGPVAPATPRIASASVQLDASYSSDTAAHLVDEARVVRPTGHYAAPGELVSVTVPPAAVGQGLSVVVGVHFRNMVEAEIGPMNRFPDISTEFPLDAATISVANPLGGGIYLKVPDGSNVGQIQVTIEDAIKSPYFSGRAGSQTVVADWLAEVAASGAPWADFESDRFMFSMPVHLLAGVNNPDQIMARWDAIMDAVDAVGGRSTWQRPRAEFYIADTRLVTPAFGAGYPMVIPISIINGQDEWNPLEVLTARPAHIFLHELGHNQHHPTMTYGDVAEPCHEIEAESVIHILALSVYHTVYGDSLAAAFAQAIAGQALSVEQALFDWIITADFRQGEPIAYDESMAAGDPETTADDILEDKNQIKYQARGLGNRADIARLFGISGLGAVNAEFYQAGVPQVGTACGFRPHIVGRDEYIRAASQALGVNMAPLFHLWGINPSPGLRDELAAGFPNSEAIRSMLLGYRANVAPKSYGDYLAWHNQIYPQIGYQQPRYDYYLANFDSTYVDDIDAQFDFLHREYFSTIFEAGFE